MLVQREINERLSFLHSTRRRLILIELLLEDINNDLQVKEQTRFYYRWADNWENYTSPYPKVGRHTEGGQKYVMSAMFEYRDHTCFSCINICWVPGKLFELEVDRPSVQTSPEGPDRC